MRGRCDIGGPIPKVLEHFLTSIDYQKKYIPLSITQNAYIRVHVQFLHQKNKVVELILLMDKL